MLLQNPITIWAFSAHLAQIHEAAISLTEKFQEIVTPGLWWVVVLAGRQAVVVRTGLTAHGSCQCRAVSRVQCSFPCGGRKVQMVTVPDNLQVNVCARCVPIWLQFYWSLECFPGRWFIEGVRVNFSVTAFSSLFHLALPTLAWYVYLVIVRYQECIAVMTEECIWAANSSEFWEVTGSLLLFHGINPQ